MYCLAVPYFSRLMHVKYINQKSPNSRLSVKQSMQYFILRLSIVETKAVYSTTIILILKKKNKY
jgi:hypothetical protein